jgi:DNA-binding IclR family transcriptional regulator
MAKTTAGEPAAGERLQALERGLQVLAHANRHGVLRTAEVARALRMSRSTVHRIVNVLAELGLLRADPDSHQYFLAPGVRELSRGFRDDAWIERVAAPALRGWTAQHHWPLLLVTPIDGVLTVRESTDHESPIAADRFVPGEIIPAEGSAAGELWRAWLGTGSPAVRRAGWFATSQACHAGARVAVPVTLDEAFVGCIVMLCLPGTIDGARRLRPWVRSLQALASTIAADARPLLGGGEA